MVSFLMLGSFILGLIALILPILNIIRYKNNYNKNWATYSIISMNSLAIALNFQVLYSNLMVRTDDLSALMDTSATSAFLSVVLLITVVILNMISLRIYRKKPTM